MKFVRSKYCLHTITHNASNSRIIAGINGIAGDWAIGQNPLGAFAVDAIDNNRHVARAKLGAIDGMSTYKWQ